MVKIKREHTPETFADHKKETIEYGSKADTILMFAKHTGYNVDIVRKERKFRSMY